MYVAYLTSKLASRITSSGIHHDTHRLAYPPVFKSVIKLKLVCCSLLGSTSARNIIQANIFGQYIVVYVFILLHITA